MRERERERRTRGHPPPATMTVDVSVRGPLAPPREVPSPAAVDVVTNVYT